MLAEAHQLEISDDASMIGWCITHEQARIAQHAEQDNVRLNPHLPETQAEIALPLIVGGTCLGAINIQSTQPNAFSEDDIDVMGVVADQLAVAIDNARLNELLKERRVTEQAALLELSQELLGEVAMSEIMDMVLQTTVHLLEVEFAALTLVDEDERTFSTLASIGWSAEMFAQAQSILIDTSTGNGYTILQREVVVVPDESQETRFNLPPSVAQAGITSALFVPIMIAEKAVLGTLVVNSRQARQWNDDEIRLLSLIATTTAQALERARLFEVERQNVHFLATLNDITRAALETADISIMLQTLADRLIKLFGADICYISLWDETQQRTILGTATGPQMKVVADLEIKPDEPTLTESVLHSGQPLVVEDVLNSPHISPRIAAKFPSVSLLGLPMIAGKQKLGAVLVGYNQPHPFIQDEIARGEQAAGQIALALAKSQLLEQSQQRARELSTLHNLGQSLASTTTLNEIYQTVYQHVAQAYLDMPHFAVALFDRETQTISCAFAIVDGVEADPAQFPALPLEEGPFSNTIRTRQIQIVDLDEVRPQLTARGRMVQIGDERLTRSSLYLPLVSGDEAIGAINLQSYQTGAFDQINITLVSGLANQTAVAMVKVQLLEKERRQRALAEALSESASAMSSTLSLDEVLDIMLQSLGQVVEFDSVSIQLIGEDGCLYLAAGAGFPDIDIARKVVRDLSDHSLDKTFAEGRELVIPDILADDRWVVVPEVDYVRSWIGAPLMVKDRLIGTLNVDSCQVNAYDASTGEVVMAFANQAAIAIENARLFETEKIRHQELDALYDLLRKLVATDESDIILDLIAKHIVVTIHVTFVRIVLLENGSFTCRAAAPIRLMDHALVSNNPEPPEAWRFYHQCLNQDQLMKLTADEQSLSDKERKAYMFDLAQTLYLIPLKVSDNKIGVLVLGEARTEDREPFDRNKRDLTMAMADQAALAIAKARLYEAERNSRQQAETLREITTTLVASLDFDSLLNSILLQLQQVILYDSACIFLLEDGHVTAIAQRGLPMPEESFRQEFPLVNPLFLELQDSCQPLILADAQTDPRYKGWGSTGNVRGWIGTPLISQNEVIGFLTIDNLQVSAYSEQDANLAQAFANQASIAIVNARLYQSTQQHATQLEQRVAERTNELNHTLERLNLATQAAKIGVWDWNIEQDVLIWDAQMYNLYGVEPEEFSGAYEAWVNGLHPDDAAFSVAELEKALRGEKVFDTQFRIVWPNGSIRHIKALGHVLRDSKGTALRATGVNFDITEQVVSAKALAEANQHLLLGNQISNQLSSILDVDQLLDKVVTSVSEALGYYHVSIALVEGDETVFIKTIGGEQPVVPGTRLKIGQEGIVGWVAAHGQAVLVTDVTQDSRYYQHPALTSTRSELAVPVCIAGRVLGVLNVESDQLAAFGEEDQNLLQSIADQLALALENARSFQEAQEQRDEANNMVYILFEQTNQMVGMNRVATNMLGALCLADAIKEINRGFAEELSLDKFALWIEQNGGLLLAGAAGLPHDLGTEISQLPMYQAVEQVWQSGNPDWRTRYSGEVLSDGFFEDCIMLPLKAHNLILGVLVTERDVVDEDTLRVFINQVSLGLAAARSYQSLEEQAVVLADTNAELLRATQAKTDFMNKMSHELRTPLNAMLGFSNLLIKERFGPLNDKQMAYVVHILDSADHQLALVNDILDLAKIEAGKIELNLEKSPVEDLFASALSMVIGPAQEKHVQLTTHVSPPNLFVIADALRLRQILLNLLSNAVKFTPEGGEISMTAEEVNCGSLMDQYPVLAKSGLLDTQSCTQFTVSDTGIGIEKDDFLKVFAEFEQIDSPIARKETGTGLGMALTKHLVELHGGHIWFESELDIGTTFFVAWPSAQEEN